MQISLSQIIYEINHQSSLYLQQTKSALLFYSVRERVIPYKVPYDYNNNYYCDVFIPRFSYTDLSLTTFNMIISEYIQMHQDLNHQLMVPRIEMLTATKRVMMMTIM